ncbi:MAG TPA: pyrimidine 5'-nucleotidase [Deltaproteobacteria bacterium]|jgi:putative hydrolase of the HAD superfamily|nr:pyrimidine 5'-nucleotidase [Deltaproteobacteria bacterium]
MLASASVDVLLLDLDETLYPPERGVLRRVDQRINAYLRERMGIPRHEVDGVRCALRNAHGTTLRGLVLRHRVDQDDYLRFVHGCDLSDLLGPDPELRELLERLPPRKVVFTNAPRAHARQVLRLLEVENAFHDVVALEDLGYLPKPHPEAYGEVLSRVGAPASACCLVDDTRANLLPASALGMRTVWKAKQARACDRVHHAIAELRELEALWR